MSNLAGSSLPPTFTSKEFHFIFFTVFYMLSGISDLYEPFNSFFDHIYVITIEKASERREKLKQRLEGLDFEFFYGMDKSVLQADTELLQSVYSEKKSKELHRYGKPMTIGHIACSLSHCLVYKDILEKGYKNALILEDDVVPMIDLLPLVPNILSELPADWQLLYWGYDKHEQSDLKARIKQLFYHFTSTVKLLKWNRTMVKNLVAKAHSTHLKKAGYHDLSHAYSITEEAAKKILEFQTAVVLNADTVLSYCATNEWLKAYITSPEILKQEYQVSPDTYVSYIKD